jgi:splicing factor U2AF subunit
MSQTLLLSHMYPNTPEALALANDEPWDDDMYDRAQQHLEAFYIEVFLELANYGEIEDVVVVDNLCDHLIGNVYVKYYHEEDAERALGKLTGRFYSGKLIQAEYTTVSDFREARCRAFHETRCNRGAYCNFLHIKHIPKAIKRRVVREMYDEHPEYLGQTSRSGKSKKDKKEKGEKKDRDGDRSRSRRRRRDDEGEKKESGGGDGGEGGGGGGGRQTSEERRAMIASWNKDKEGGDVLA